MRSLNAPFASGREVNAPYQADYIEAVVGAADTIVSVPIPAGAHWWFFNHSEDVWVKAGVTGTTFTVPAATTTDGTGPELNPPSRSVYPGETHLKLRATNAFVGSIAFYS